MGILVLMNKIKNKMVEIVFILLSVEVIIFSFETVEELRILVTSLIFSCKLLRSWIRHLLLRGILFLARWSSTFSQLARLPETNSFIGQMFQIEIFSWARCLKIKIYSLARYSITSANWLDFLNEFFCWLSFKKVMRRHVADLSFTFCSRPDHSWDLKKI